MKLNGKKTLALLIVLAMSLSVCVMPAYATGEPVVLVESVAIEGGSTYIGKTLNLSSTVLPENATNKALNWDSSNKSVATVNSSGVVTALSAGTTTITATAVDGSNKAATATVTVLADTIASVTSQNISVAVAYGTKETAAASALANKELNVTYSQGGTGKATISGWAATEEYKATTPGQYSFATMVNEATITATVTVNKATVEDTSLDSVYYVPLGTEEDDLDDYLDSEVKISFKEFNGSVEFDIGGSDDYFAWWDCTAKYDEDEEKTYTFKAKAKTHELYDLKDLSIAVKVYDENFELTADYDGVALSGILSDIDDLLSAISGYGFDVIEFDAITGYDETEDEEDEDYVGGVLYFDSDCEIEVDVEEAYEMDDIEDAYFLPNGSGYTTYIYYTAWNDDDEIEGCIEIYSDAFLLLQAEIDTEGTLDFDAADFADLVEEWNDDYTLSHIDNVKIITSNGGSLYYDYDEDSKKNTKISSTEEYYVDEDEDDLIDKITYVPGSNTSGTVTITFDAIAKKGSKTTKTLEGIYQISVVELADVIVEVDRGGTAVLDWSVFEDYFDDTVSSTKKNYTITYIEFSGAPASKAKGYLCDDGDKISKPSGKQFYYSDKDDGDYAWDDLTYVGGTTAGSYRAEFTIYGKKNSSSTSSTELVTGTIDFVVGTSNTIANPDSPLKAAQVMPFSYELDAFASLGDNDNVCIEFTSLPQGAKLYYNYGLSTQEDVTVGTQYYITSTAGKKLLKNVTFVPSYSSDKIAKVISFGLKGYDKNGKSVNGMANISVTYAYYSAYFSDISGSLYADSVDFLKNQGITTGVPGGKYDAAGQLSRAELVTFLYRAAGSPAVSGTSKFTDVPKNEYYYAAVLWATQNGITKGTNAAGTLFSPNKKVTNQEIIQFMYNYDVVYLKHTSYVAGSTSYVYDFNQVADWAQTAVKWAVGKNVLTPGYLNPTTVGTRGNIALYLHRMLTL